MKNGISLWVLGWAVLGAGVWWWWTNEGATPNTHVPTLEDVFAPEAFHAYAWWTGHGHGEAYVHHYPDTIAPQRGVTPLANELGALSTTQNEGTDIDG